MFYGQHSIFAVQRLNEYQPHSKNQFAKLKIITYFTLRKKHNNYMNIQNPFIVSGYVSPEYFCDREKETEKIISAINSGRNITLFSIRRIGKTGLIEHVFHNLKKGKKFKLFYIDILPTQNVQTLINILANNIVGKFESRPEMILKRIGEVFSSVRPVISFDPTTGTPNVSFDLQNEKEKTKTIEQIFNYLSAQKKNIVIAIDEFQQIANYPEKNIEAILRANIQRLRNVNFIFSGSHQHLLTSMFSQYGKPFYQSTDMMPVNKLDKDKYSKFIHNKFRIGKMEINKENVNRILDWTRTHTFYTQFFCNRVWAKAVPKITDEVIIAVMKEIMEENESVFVSYRNLLTEYQWKVLKAIAKEGSIRRILSQDFISKHKLHTTSSVQTSIKALIDKEMIYKENEYYFVYDVFLERWLEIH